MLGFNLHARHPVGIIEDVIPITQHDVFKCKTVDRSPWPGTERVAMNLSLVSSPANMMRPFCQITSSQDFLRITATTVLSLSISIKLAPLPNFGSPEPYFAAPTMSRRRLRKPSENRPSQAPHSHDWHDIACCFGRRGRGRRESIKLPKLAACKWWSKGDLHKSSGLLRQQARVAARFFSSAH